MITAISKLVSSLILRNDDDWNRLIKTDPELPLLRNETWPIKPGFYPILGDENSGKTTFAEEIFRDQLGFKYFGIDEPDEEHYSVSDEDFLTQIFGEISVLLTPANYTRVLPANLIPVIFPNPNPQLITQLGLRWPTYHLLIVNSFKQRMYLPSEQHENAVEGGIRTHLFLSLTALSIILRKYGIRFFAIFPTPPVNAISFVRRAAQSSTGYVHILQRGNKGSSSQIIGKVRQFLNREEFTIPFIKP